MESVEVVLRGLAISPTPGPIMIDMMDKLTISTPLGSAPHQDTSEPKVELQNDKQNDVTLVSSYLYPTPDTPWLDYSEHCCEFCGHRAPHTQLKMLHTRRYASNHNDKRREMYSKREKRAMQLT
uniref:Uncharacterized protein n=1 Tax=Lygus hesperus TaxID=30085 RepID=A0A146MD20_LYGHE